jgi:hypothetical protein
VDQGRLPIRLGQALAYGAVLAIALLAVLATLAWSAPTDPETLSAHYGKPVWFAESDMSTERGLSKRELRHPVPFNPWENPSHISGGRFLLSYLVFAAPLAGLVWLVTRWRRQSYSTATR